MKVKIIEDKCIGCGNCVSVTDGEVFDFNDDGMAYVVKDVIETNMETNVSNAIEQCPTGAIVEEK